LRKKYDTAVFTTIFVLEDKKTITYVTHELEDEAWQFLSDDKFDDFEKVAKVVGLQEIIDIDPTLKNIIDMDEGYYATRKSKKDNWIINKIE
jgi:hypothetical protein